MTKKLCVLMAVLAVMTCMLAVAIDAKVRPTDPRLNRAQELKPVADPGDDIIQSTRMPVGFAAVAANPTVDSRGKRIAQTYQDRQMYCANRAVAVNPYVGPASVAGVHMTFTIRESEAATKLYWGYYCYDPLTGTAPIPGGKIIVHEIGATSGQSGEYPRIAADHSGRAVVAGHDWLDFTGAATVINNHISTDLNPMVGDFGGIDDGTRMCDAVEDLNNLQAGANTRFPVFDMTTTATDTISYLFCIEDGANNTLKAVKLFRKVGTAPASPDCSWQLVFRDTTWYRHSTEMSCDPTSMKVGVCWIKGIPPDATQNASDIWYATSPDGTAGSFTKQNLTNYGSDGNTSYQAWLELTDLFDSQGKYHIAWNAFTPGGAARTMHIFHWSQHMPANIYTAVIGDWDMGPACGTTGFNVGTVGKIGIGECDGRLYMVYSSWNDPAFTPLQNDCSKSASSAHSANGEIFLSVAKTIEGKAWDQPRNLSNSPSPGCDTNTCADDRWASISRQGIDDALFSGAENWGNAETYDPSLAYTGSSYTQVTYVTDRYPGNATSSQGPYTLNDVRWIRLACVPPIVASLMTTTPRRLVFPEYTEPGNDTTYDIILESIGNADVVFTSVTDIEDSTRGVGAGPTNWMNITNVPALIPEGGRDTMTLTMNAAGVITAGPTLLYGKIRFIFTLPLDTFDMPIVYTVADTVPASEWDTIGTSCLDLIVASNGNMGNNYDGRVNMDYAGNLNECDTGSDSRGDAEIYLGDASPVIIRKPTPTTYRMSVSVFGEGYTSPNGFRPMTGAGFAPHGLTTTSSYDMFNSGTFISSDSLIKVEKTWWAPKHSDSCNFIVQRMRVFSANIANAVTGLQIGEAFDFDIPTDSGTSNNISGSDQTRRLVYMRGYDSAGAATDCTENSKRYGGAAMLNFFMKNKSCNDSLYSGKSIANDAYVYPANGFVADSISRVMRLPVYSTESRITDQTLLFTYRDGASGWTLPANDTLTVFTAMATVRTASASPNAGLDSLKKAIDKAKEFMKKNIGVCASCCQGVTGNVNTAGIVDLSDLSALVSFLTGGGYALPCVPEANVNNAGIVDLSDLSALVSFLTGGGYVLPNCG